MNVEKLAAELSAFLRGGAGGKFAQRGVRKENVAEHLFRTRLPLGKGRRRTSKKFLCLLRRPLLALF